jgi:hypothetical protein
MHGSTRSAIPPESLKEVIVMKNVILTLLFGLAGISVTWADAPGGCSLATLKGTYGGLEEGTILLDFGYPFPPPPFLGVVVGSVTYDGAGNLAINYMANFGGLTIPGTATGTYTVNPDCTYTDEVPSTDAHRVGVITGEGMLQELHVMFTDFWVVGSGIRKKAPQGNCSAETVKGTYALLGQGTAPGPVSLAHTGFAFVDGKGIIAGEDTQNIGGGVMQSTFTGTYSVNPDCTVSNTTLDTSELYPPTNEFGVIVGVGQNQEVWSIITDPGYVFVDKARRK